MSGRRQRAKRKTRRQYRPASVPILDADRNVIGRVKTIGQDDDGYHVEGVLYGSDERFVAVIPAEEVDG